MLADKAKFAAYAKSIGATRLLPRTFRLDRPKFPAVLKRTDLNSGNGVAVVTSREQLDARLASAPWAGRPVLLQALVPAHTDHVTYLVCVEGKVVWHRTYAYRLAQPDQIRGPVVTQTGKRKRTRPRDIRAFETLLLPLRYSGPANVDYRRRPDGSVAILEINPRLGGSLMKPENVGDLAACLAAIVRHARWRPAPAPRPAAASGEARA